MNSNEIYVSNPSYIMREIAGEILLVPIGEQTKILNGLITFSETGAFVWKHIDGNNSILDIATLLSQEYDVSLDETLPDTYDFFEDAFKNGLIKRLS